MGEKSQPTLRKEQWYRHQHQNDPMAKSEGISSLDPSSTYLINGISVPCKDSFLQGDTTYT